MRHEEWQEVMHWLRRAYQCSKKIPLSVWSVGNLISTALRLLQSETSDSGGSVEQMDEMNLYDNIGDEKEKRSIKMKNKSQKNRSFLLNQLYLWQTPLPSILKPLGLMDLLLNHR